MIAEKTPAGIVARKIFAITRTDLNNPDDDLMGMDLDHFSTECVRDDGGRVKEWLISFSCDMPYAVQVGDLDMLANGAESSLRIENWEYLVGEDGEDVEATFVDHSIMLKGVLEDVVVSKDWDLWEAGVTAHEMHKYSGKLRARAE